MADRQPTGGYPKIATVIGADLGRLAQKRPGDIISFQSVTLEEAVAARRALFSALALGPQQMALHRDMTTEALLAGNLVGGVISATDEPSR
jgi:allophanate hydrolase subunit 2